MGKLFYVMVAMVILLLELMTVDIVATSSDSQLLQKSPANVFLYYDSQKLVKSICVPPSNSNFSISWWKDGVRLSPPNTVNNSGSYINITTVIADTEKLAFAYQVANDSVISILSINNVVASDGGEYSCVASNEVVQLVANFTVNITDNCKSGTFKCEMDKKCIMGYMLCNGIAECSKAYDESIQVGCSVPPAPSELTTEHITGNSMTIKWQPVANVYSYEIRLLHSNKTKLKNQTFTMITFRELEPDTRYSVSLRSKSLTGFSNFSEELFISTLPQGIPDAPENIRTGSTTIRQLQIQWDKTKYATSYQVVLTSPTGDKRLVSTEAKVTRYLFSSLKSNTSYRVKVRAYSGDNGYGNFSEEISVKTLMIKSPGAPRNVKQIDIPKTQSVRLSWTVTGELGNTPRNELQYRTRYCILQSYQRMETVFRETDDSSAQSKDDKILNDKELTYDSLQTMTNNDDMTKITMKKAVNVMVTRYRKVKCRETPFTRRTESHLSSLAPGFYWFGVYTFGANKIRGNASEGNFTIKMNTTAPPEQTEAISSTIDKNGIVTVTWGVSGKPQPQVICQIENETSIILKPTRVGPFNYRYTGNIKTMLLKCEKKTVTCMSIGYNGTSIKSTTTVKRKYVGIGENKSKEFDTKDGIIFALSITIVLIIILLIVLRKKGMVIFTSGNTESDKKEPGDDREYNPQTNTSNNLDNPSNYMELQATYYDETYQQLAPPMHRPK